MNLESARVAESLPIEALLRLAAVCDRFEEACNAGPVPQIEDFLQGNSPAERMELLYRLVELDREYRERLRTPVPVEAYRRRFPALDARWLDQLAASASNANMGVAAESKQASGEEPTNHNMSATDRPPLPVRVGRYQLEHELASGGMGQVMRVKDELFNRPMAMKISGGADPKNQDVQERLNREALLTGQLQHPGVPPVQELGQLEDGRRYFIMKLVKGSNLEKLLRQRTSTAAELPRFIAIFEQICQTLGSAAVFILLK